MSYGRDGWVLGTEFATGWSPRRDRESLTTDCADLDSERRPPSSCPKYVDVLRTASRMGRSTVRGSAMRSALPAAAEMSFLNDGPRGRAWPWERTHGGRAGLQSSRMTSRRLGLVAAACSRTVAMRLRRDCSRSASTIVLVSEARTTRPRRVQLTARMSLRLAGRPRRSLSHAIAQPGVHRIRMHPRMPEHRHHDRWQLERQCERVHAGTQGCRVFFRNGRDQV